MVVTWKAEKMFSCLFFFLQSLFPLIWALSHDRKDAKPGNPGCDLWNHCLSLAKSRNHYWTVCSFAQKQKWTNAVLCPCHATANEISGEHLLPVWLTQLALPVQFFSNSPSHLLSPHHKINTCIPNLPSTPPRLWCHLSKAFLIRLKKSWIFPKSSAQSRHCFGCLLSFSVWL